MEKQKIKVLDLFSGTQSVRKAFEKQNIDIDYIGVDIYSPEKENLILDLTSENIIKKLLAKLPKGWKPDFIWASPPCETFSLANPGKGSANLHYEVVNDNLYARRDFAAKGKGLDFEIRSIKQTAISLACVANMKEIIKHFDVPFAVENPGRSLIRYLLKDLIINDVDYCMYGFDVKKWTYIFTNKPIILQRCNHKERHKAVIAKHKITYENSWNNHKYDDVKRVETYAERSRVPEELIIDIFLQLT